jgi:hypothetical protein
MNSQDLLNSLLAQEQNVDSLLQILQTMKTAIVHNDFKTLEQTINEEQLMLRKISTEDEARKKAMMKLVDTLSLEMNAPSLEKVLENGKSKLGKEYDVLQKVRKSLKEKLKEVSHLNTVLKQIIDISRSLIKETMLAVAGQKKHGLVNRRVF